MEAQEKGEKGSEMAEKIKFYALSQENYFL